MSTKNRLAAVFETSAVDHGHSDAEWRGLFYLRSLWNLRSRTTAFETTSVASVAAAKLIMPDEPTTTKRSDVIGIINFFSFSFLLLSSIFSSPVGRYVIASIVQYSYSDTTVRRLREWNTELYNIDELRALSKTTDRRVFFVFVFRNLNTIRRRAHTQNVECRQHVQTRLHWWRKVPCGPKAR